MNIEEKVKDILKELSDMEISDTSLKLQEDIALNSLAMVTLLVEIEDVFCIELDEADMNPFDLTTVQSVIDMVKKYCGDEYEDKC